MGFTLSCLGIGVFFKDFLRPVSNAMRCLSPAQIECLSPREAPSLIALLDQRRNTQNNEQGEIREERSINYFCLVQLSDSFSPALEQLLLSVIHCALLNNGSSDSSLLFLSSAWLSLLLSPLAVCFAVVYTPLLLIILLENEKCNSCIIHIHKQHLCGWQGWHSAVETL